MSSEYDSSTRFKNLSLATETCNLIGFHPNSEYTIVFADKYGILTTDLPSLVWTSSSCCIERSETGTVSPP